MKLVLKWSLNTIFFTILCVAGIFYLNNRAVPVKTDSDGYKILKIALPKDGTLFVKKLLENTVQKSGKKIKLEYTKKNPHIAVTMIGAKAKRYIYDMQYFGAKKMFINPAETASFGFYRSRRDFHDFGLKNKNTVLAMGYLYSMSTKDRYAYLPEYFFSLPGLFDSLPSVNNIQRILGSLVSKRHNNLKQKKDKFCAMIYRDDDRLGVRGRIFEACQEIEFVHSLGAFRHNSDLLWQKNGGRSGSWHLTKMEVLPEFKFNICAENSNVNGYISEKLIDALVAGCVPLYCGCGNRPSPKIFNQSAILFWHPGEDNTETIERIKQLYKDKEAFESFIHQPIFLSTAATSINDILTDLYSKLEKVILTLCD